MQERKCKKRLKYDEIHSRVIILVGIGFIVTMSMQVGILYGIPVGGLCTFLFHLSMRPQKNDDKKS